MTSRTTDINLIIRAKTEGEAAISGLAKAVDDLVNGAGAGNKDIAELGRTLLALDKAAASAAGAQEKVAASSSKQAAAVHAAAASIAEQKERVDTLRRGLELLAAESDKAFVGPKRDGLSTLIRTAKGELTDAERALRSNTAAYERNLTALRTSRSGLLDLQRTTTDVADAQGRARDQIAQTTLALEAQAEAAANAARSTPIQQRINAVTGVGRAPKSASQSAGVFAAADEGMEQEARNLRDVLNPLAAIQNNFNNALARYRVLAAEGRISSDELAAAEKHLGAEAEAARARLSKRSSAGLFGLNSYELQNLSYQVNDVVTGLASGQHATQVIAQQGGQILQLFPRVISGIGGALKNPAVLAASAAVIGLGIALKSAADDAERLRQITSTLSLRADGGSYDAKALADQERGFERLGASAEDAKKAIQSFLDNSIAPDRIAEFGRVAYATSQILGTDLPTAADQVAKAFTGGYQAIADFDDKLNFLTASQREHIRQLFEEGKASEARAEALKIYGDKAEDTASKQRGPWSDAAKSLGKAWDSFLESLANSAPIRSATLLLNGLADVIKDIADRLAGIDPNNTVAKMVRGQFDQYKPLAEEFLNSPEAQKRFLGRALKPEEVAMGRKAIGAFDRATTLTAPKKPGGDTLSNDPNSPEAKRAADQVHQLKAEDELQKLRDAGQVRALSLTEQRRRIQLAGDEAARNAADATVAAAQRALAVDKERAKIARESDARSKQAAAEREREIKQFEGRVIGAEGGGGKNPHSSASGYGQFIESTFIDQFTKVFPEQARALSREQILALRQNASVARAIIDNYARENARFLEGFGAKVTAGNLYLTHFLGRAGAKAILTAPENTPVDQILSRQKNSEQVLNGNRAYLRTDGGKGRYRTAGELRKFIAGRVGDTGEAQTAGEVELTKLIDDARQKQDEFNLSVRHGNEDRARTIEALKAENGLFGNTLLLEQRRRTIAAAEAELRQKVEDANKNLKEGQAPVVVTPEQVRDARDYAAAYFDALHAKEALSNSRDNPQRGVDDLREQVDLLKQQAEYYRSIGDNNTASQIDDQVMSLTGHLADAYDKLIAFYKALSPTERAQLGILDQQQLDNIIAKLEQAKQLSEEWGKILGISAQDVAHAFASAAVNAFTNFINKVAAGRNVFRSLIESVREFAAAFIQAVAQMILQLLAYAAAVAILRALGVPIPGGGVAAPSHHTGGIVGQGSGVTRTVSPMLFAKAMRFHTGGIVGLAPDEQAIIARKGEEVLTQSDPRHRDNLGRGRSERGSRKSGDVSVINVFDPSDVVDKALSASAGSRVLINHVRDNQSAFRAALGVS